MFEERQRAFLDGRRVGRLATADAGGRPHVVPACFALGARGVYITVDEKPKRKAARPLKRIRNILENPSVALVVDRYDEGLEPPRLGHGEGFGGNSGERRRARPGAGAAAGPLPPSIGEWPWRTFPSSPSRAERVTSWGNLD